jgi:hypothetical protein
VKVNGPFATCQIQDDPASLSPEEKRALIQRVLDGDMFRRSPAMRAFLLYISEYAILGRSERLKEQTIGVEVLGRRPNYDPADDNIVRVRAHELRGRLEKHFTTEGREEPIILKVPKGSYVPEFVARKELSPDAAEPAPIVDKPVQEGRSAPPVNRQWLLVTVMLIVAITGSVILTRYMQTGGSGARDASISGAMHDFWGQFFDKPNEELKIVYADTSYALWQDLNDKTLNLGDYLNRNYLNAQGNKLFNLAMRRVTSTADITIAARLGALAGRFHGQPNLQFSRDVTTDFFHHGNLVLIGSHRSNPWVEVFEPSLNFVLDQDPNSGAPLFRNRSPQPGEARTYSIPAAFDTQKAYEGSYTSYGVIALLRGCGDRGLTVLLEGLNTQATQAMGDLVTDPQRLDTFLRSMGHTAGTNVTPFEALVQITSLPGQYDNPKVLAYRLRPPGSCIGG